MCYLNFIRLYYNIFSKSVFSWQMGALQNHGAVTSVSPGVILVTHLCSCQVWEGSSSLSNFLVNRWAKCEYSLRNPFKNKQNNGSESCVRHGDIRHLCPEASGGAGPDRPLPGVPGLLPGGHPAAHRRVERSLLQTNVHYR